MMALSLATLGRTTEADGAMRRAFALSSNPLEHGFLSRMPPKIQSWASNLRDRLLAEGAFGGARFLATEAAADDGCASRRVIAWADHYSGDDKTASAEFDALWGGPCSDIDNALMGGGISRIGLGDLKTAGALLARSLSIAPDNTRAQMAQGAVAYVGGDYAEAIRIYSEHMSALPPAGRIWSWGDFAIDNLGWSYYFTKNYPLADQTFRKLEAYGDGPREASALAGRGWVALQQGRMAEAREFLARALILAPGLQVARAGLEAVQKSGHD